MSPLRTTAAVLLVCGSCASGPVRIRGAAPPGAVVENGAVVAEVAALRELPLRRPITIRYNDKPRSTDNDRAWSYAGRTAEWLAFGLVDPSFVGAGAKRSAEVVQSRIGGTYSHRSQVIDVYGAHGDGSTDKSMPHEVVHALQDQHFRLANLSRVGTEDEMLAHRALAEGDADFTRILREGLRAGRKPEDVHAMLHGAGSLADNTDLIDPDLDDLPPIVRESAIFPYRSGTRLVALVHSAGGFALVDRMYRQPPASTEQVLHPQKYLDGEPAVSVPTPVAPSGWRKVTEGSLGELGTRTMLARCLGNRTARLAAEDWGGDRYVVLAKPGPRLALLWSTVWDDAAAALDFATAMRSYANTRCIAMSSGLLTGALRVWREGVQVAVVRGLDETAGGSELQKMVATSVVTPPMRPPLGPVKLPPPPPLPLPRLELAEGTYESDVLGIAADLPDDHVASVNLDSGALEMTGSVKVWLAPGPPRDPRSALDMIARSFDRRIAAEIAGGAPPADRTTLETPLGTAYTAHWERNSGPRAGHMRVVVLPMCEGRRSVTLACSWRDEAGEGLLRTWLSSFRRLHGAASYCAQAGIGAPR